MYIYMLYVCMFVYIYLSVGLSNHRIHEIVNSGMIRHRQQTRLNPSACLPEISICFYTYNLQGLLH